MSPNSWYREVLSAKKVTKKKESKEQRKVYVDGMQPRSEDKQKINELSRECLIEKERKNK